MNDEKKLVYEDDFIKKHLKDMDCVKSCLDYAVEAGLEVEVVTYALIAMQADPNLSVGDAMLIGYSEWIK